MKKYCNFEYEIHCNGDKVYVRGNLISITSKPKYKVYTHDVCAWNDVLNEKSVYETSENIMLNEGYSMSAEDLEEVDDEH